MMSDPKENAPDKAKRLGLVLVIPDDHELFIDIDNSAALAEFHRRWPTFLKVCPNATKQYTMSSGGNWHVYVTVPNKTFTMDTRLILQAALGSDPLREMIAAFHHDEGYIYPSVFFEKPDSLREDMPHRGGSNIDLAASEIKKAGGSGED